MALPEMTALHQPLIRTVTAFVSLSKGTSCEEVGAAATAAAALTGRLSRALQDRGFVVQTQRVATSCLLDWAGGSDGELLSKAAIASFLHGAEMVPSACAAPLLISLGRLPAKALAGKGSLVDSVASLLGSNPLVSMSADLQAGDRSAAAACARLVQWLSRAGAGDGMSNFQFCVSCNVPPCTPFFPAAYAPEPIADASGPQPLRFAIGLQHGALTAAAAKAAAAAAAASADPEVNVVALFEKELRMRLDTICAEIASIVSPVAAETDAGGSAPIFCGFDTSLAPAPGEVPLTEIYAALDAPRFGGPGSLEISAAITRALQGVSSVPLSGYCGLMLPPLEDVGLAAAVKSGDVTLRDLLLHSTVCGIGWDTVPIAGDASVDDMAALFRDVAALSAKWSKPLSVRLFPVPGLTAGDMTAFDSPYLTNTTVMKL